MGGVTQSLGKAIGMGPKKVVERVVDNALAEKEDTRASRMDEEQGARMRGARRRGRQLLSDARLNTAGDETLGGGNSL
jgi:hypothetical protein